MSPRKPTQTFKLVQAGVYAALIVIAITFIKVPMPSAISKSFVHPGNALVILGVLLMGFKRGTAATLIGLAIFDALNGYLTSIPSTLLENFIVILAVVLVHKYLFKKNDHLPALITIGITGGALKVLLRFIKFTFRQLLIGANLSAALATATTGLPASIFTAIVTAALVPLLYYPMKQIFERFHPIGE